MAYLQRLETQLLVEFNQKSEFVLQQETELYIRKRTEVFESCEECIEWIERRMVRLVKDIESVIFISFVQTCWPSAGRPCRFHFAMRGGGHKATVRWWGPRGERTYLSAISLKKLAGEREGSHLGSTLLSL